MFQSKFRQGDPTYHLFLTTRLNLLSALLRAGIDVWLMQQDTIWSDHALRLMPALASNVDIGFDEAGYAGSLHQRMVQGGDMYFRATPATVALIAKTADITSRWWVLDVAVWSYQCVHGNVNCAYFPHRYHSSWEWLFHGNRTQPPVMMQLDADSGVGKLESYRKLGLYFINDSDLTCNDSQVEHAVNSFRNGSLQTDSYMPDKMDTWVYLSYFTNFLMSLPFVGNWVHDRIIFPMNYFMAFFDLTSMQY